MVRLKLDQVKSFLEVVRLGGIRKASLALHLSQPAVTARIKNLEDTLRKPLFDRSANRMLLTKEGELFMRHAEAFEQVSNMVERDFVTPDC